jgi:hypothetical protein
LVGRKNWSIGVMEWWSSGNLGFCSRDRQSLKDLGQIIGLMSFS